MIRNLLILASALSFLFAHSVSAAEVELETFGRHDFSAMIKTLENDEAHRIRHLNQVANQGERCGTFNTCAEGTECVKAIMGKRCFPQECLVKAAADFQNNYDFDSQNQKILNQAGITEEQLGEAYQRAGDLETFQQTDEFKAYVAAFKSNPINAWKFQRAAQECDRAATSPGLTIYSGFHFEFGFIADLTIQFFTDVSQYIPNNETAKTWFRGCFGAEMGAGIESSGMVGLGFTGTPSDMTKGSFATDVDAALMLALGVAWGINFNGVYYLDFTMGLGVGINFFGINICGAWEL